MSNVALFGTKVGMTRIFVGDKAEAVTVVEIQPNEVVEIKKEETHGYSALKVAVGPKKRKVSKPLQGEYKKADVAPRRFLREIPMVDDVELGSKVTVEQLAEGEKIDVTAVSKGRGFAGVMKRHNFAGHEASHGVSKSHRGGGSIGACADPSRVWKNQKMPGHYGNKQITVSNLTVVKIDAENNIVLLKGSVPGPNGGLVNLTQKKA